MKRPFIYVFVIFLFSLSTPLSFATEVANEDYEASSSFNYEQDVKQLLSKALGHSVNLKFSYSTNYDLGSQIDIKFQNNTLYIATAKTSFKSIAAYSYLHQLGFRFYGPEDYWTYIPKLVDSDLNQSFSVTPPFGIFRLFVSNGFGSTKNYKTSQASSQLWDRWNARLMMGVRDPISIGPGSMIINEKYKDQIIKHPDWRPKDSNGKPVRYKRGMKLCFENPEVIQLYIEFAKEDLQKKMKTGRPPYYVNIQPSDGRGFCACKTCTHGAQSNAVFNLANEVARAVQKIHPEAYVFLNAYSEYALTPDFPVEKNVLVGAVVANYQDFKPADQLFDDWINEEIPLFYRGYLNYARAGYDMPARKSSAKYVQLVEKLKQNNLFGYNYEISPSFFSNGWSLYSLSETTFSSHFDDNKEWNLFLERMFGSSSNDLATTFDLLTKGVNKIHISALISELENLQKTATDSDTKNRIDDMLHYAVYLKANYKFQETKSKADYSKLMQAIFADNDKLNIHSWGLYIANTKRNGAYKFSDTTPPLPKLDDLNYEEETDVDDLSDNQGNVYVPVQMNWKASSKMKEVITRDDFQIRFYIPTNQSSQSLQMMADGYKDKLAGQLLLIHNGKIIDQKDVIYSNRFEEYQFNLDGPGKYVLKTSRLKAVSTIKVPQIPLSFVGGLSNIRESKAQDYYFAAEKELLAFKFPRNVGPMSITEQDSGRTIFSTKQKTLKDDIVEISGFSIGKTYKISVFRNSFRIQNQPLFLSVYPEAVWHVE